MNYLRLILILVPTMFIQPNFTFAKSAAKSKTKMNSSMTDRYELFQGKYTINANGTPIKDEGVFKIDTTTGRTWIFSTGSTKTGIYFEWIPIKETLSPN